jgi:hypothetical protein
LPVFLAMRSAQQIVERIQDVNQQAGVVAEKS